MASGKTRKPGLSNTRPAGVSDELWVFLSVVKELLEAYEGVGIEPDDAILTQFDLRKIGLDKVALKSLQPSYNFLNSQRMTTPTKTVSADYELQPNDWYLNVDTSAGNVSITLPNAEGSKGFDYTISKVTSDSNTVAVNPFSGQTINSETSQTLYAEGDAMNVISNNNNWYIV